MRKPLAVKRGKTGYLSPNRLWKYLLGRPSRQSEKGKVSIVGAGPGNADYLTLKAVKTLQAADAILFDDLVTEEVLDLCNVSAEFFSVGKRGWKASCRQHDIIELMTELAMKGMHVVRLKVGDPMVFGRAGEEISALEAANIDVQVVAGITAASAMAAEIKTSLTHRDHAHGVKFITAHGAKGALPDIDWRVYHDNKTTLMVYMGGKMANRLAKKLVDIGLDANTPVIIGEAIAREEQTYHRETLASLCLLHLGTHNPVLIAIGEVFRDRVFTVDDIPEQFLTEAAA